MTALNIRIVDHRRKKTKDADWHSIGQDLSKYSTAELKAFLDDMASHRGGTSQIAVSANLKTSRIRKELEKRDRGHTGDAGAAPTMEAIAKIRRLKTEHRRILRTPLTQRSDADEKRRREIEDEVGRINGTGYFDPDRGPWAKIGDADPRLVKQYEEKAEEWALRAAGYERQADEHEARGNKQTAKKMRETSESAERESKRYERMAEQATKDAATARIYRQGQSWYWQGVGKSGGSFSSQAAAEADARKNGYEPKMMEDQPDLQKRARGTIYGGYDAAGAAQLIEQWDKEASRLEEKMAFGKVGGAEYAILGSRAKRLRQDIANKQAAMKEEAAYDALPPPPAGATTQRPRPMTPMLRIENAKGEEIYNSAGTKPKTKDIDRSVGVKRGDKIVLNRQGSKVEEVLSYNAPMVETYQGNTYHITKVFKATGPVGSEVKY